MLYTLARYPHLKNGYLRKAAFSIDQTGNAIGGYFFRDWFVKDSAPLLSLIAWGDPDKTISYALAKCDGHLTKSGKLLVWILEKLDPGHMENALKNS